MQGWACHMVARSRGAISVSPLGLWVEPEDAQFLVAPTGLGDTRRPGDGLVARRQFQHGEAAIEHGRPRIAAHCNRAVGRDEHGRYVLVDSAAEDVNTGGFRLIHHSVRVAAYRFPFAVGYNHCRAWKEIRYLAMVVSWELTAVVNRVCGLNGTC